MDKTGFAQGCIFTGGGIIEAVVGVGHLANGDGVGLFFTVFAIIFFLIAAAFIKSAYRR
jgi:hypothetical protein